MQIIRAVSDIFSSSMYLDNGAQLWRFLPSLKLNRFTNGYDTFRDLCSVYIARALEDIKNKDPNSDEDPSLLEQFFARFYQVEPAEIMRDRKCISEHNWAKIFIDSIPAICFSKIVFSQSIKKYFGNLIDFLVVK